MNDLSVMIFMWLRALIYLVSQLHPNCINFVDTWMVTCGRLLQIDIGR